MPKKNPLNRDASGPNAGSRRHVAEIEQEGGENRDVIVVVDNTKGNGGNKRREFYTFLPEDRPTEQSRTVANNRRRNGFFI